jgi:hypothetical protein
MALRYGIEFGFILFMTLFFQYEVGKFNKYLHLAKYEVQVIREHKAAYGKDEIYYEDVEILHMELKEAALDLELALMVSFVQLMLPINLFHRYFFFKKTDRKSNGMTIIDQLEYLLFFTTCIVLYK